MDRDSLEVYPGLYKNYDGQYYFPRLASGKSSRLFSCTFDPQFQIEQVNITPTSIVWHMGHIAALRVITLLYFYLRRQDHRAVNQRRFKDRPVKSTKILRPTSQSTKNWRLLWAGICRHKSPLQKLGRPYFPSKVGVRKGIRSLSSQFNPDPCYRRNRRYWS